MGKTEKGIAAEELIAKKLQEKNFLILGMRIKNRFGEIDVLCFKNEIIHIIEVKFRSNEQNFFNAVNEKKIEKCLKCFFHFQETTKIEYKDIKFIVAFVQNEKITWKNIEINCLNFHSF